MSSINNDRTNRRKMRVSRNVVGNGERPRITIFRSNRYIYAQAIDDTARKTVGAYSSLQLGRTDKESLKVKKADIARKVGQELAKILKEKNITAGVFDRGAYSYKGRVKSLAEGLREGGLQI